MKVVSVLIACLAVLVSWDAARGNSSELSRAVVIRALADKGFVAGGTIMMDRQYLLRSVAVTAHGGGEFSVRFRAQ